MATDYANLIPGNVARGLIDEVRQQSAVLRLARTVRIPAGVTSIPTVSLLPTASFVAARGGRKPSTVIEWSTEQITPEEIACIVAIPDDFIEDNSFPVWDEVRPLLAEAIGYTLDAAVLAGTGAPASFPTGGVEAAAGAPVTGATVLDAINEAMGDVEESGLMPNGHVSAIRSRRQLRMLKDANGNLVYAQAITQGEPDQLFGLPLTYSPAVDTGFTADLVTGDWTKLIVGIRSDIRFDLSNEGVITDGAGNVVVSAFEQDMTLMRCYMRAGAAIGTPITRLGPGKPFALAEFSALAGGPAGSSSSKSSKSSKTTTKEA